LRLVEQDAQLTVEAGKAGPVTLQLQPTPYTRPQLIEVRLNGQLVGQIDGSKEWKSIEASLPNLNFKAGPNLLELHSRAGCLVAADYIPNSPDQRCISFAVHKIGIEN